jgi:hypothetical protein
MTDNHLIGEDSWTALEILAEEIGRVKDCNAKREPWCPADGDEFDWAMRTYRNWHPEDAESYLMAFPWPEPGEFPNIPQRGLNTTGGNGGRDLAELVGLGRGRIWLASS